MTACHSYPEGRDISKSSQTGLHIITAFLYMLVGRSFISLLDFTIILPVFLGSLSTVVIFGLVKLISGNTAAGMFSSLFFAFSPSLIQRGNLGWFKSEPLGLFLGLIALYLFLCSLNHKESAKAVVVKAAGAGIIMGVANASWGGVQYFTIPISLFLIALPFVRKDLRFPVLVPITLTIFTLTSAASFPRPGIAFAFGMAGISLIGSTVFLINAHFLKKLSSQQRQNRNTILMLVVFVIITLAACSRAYVLHF